MPQDEHTHDMSSSICATPDSFDAGVYHDGGLEMGWEWWLFFNLTLLEGSIMAHEFESGLTIGERSWHGLECNVPLDHDARYSVEGALELAHMNWQVSKYPLLANYQSIDGDRQLLAIDDQYAIVRESDKRVLGVVGERYHPRQNVEHLGWFQPFLDSRQASITSIGSLRGGRVVYFQAQISDCSQLEILPGDQVRNLVTIFSSHDGSLLTNCGLTPQRIVCANTLKAARSNVHSQFIKCKHTKNAGSALAALRSTLDIAIGEFRATVEQYRALATKTLSQADIRKYVKAVLDVSEVADTDLPTRTANMIDEILGYVAVSPGNDGTENSAWKAFNGVTYWLTHKRGKDENRTHSLWFGPNADTLKRAEELALAL